MNSLDNNEANNRVNDIFDPQVSENIPNINLVNEINESNSNIEKSDNPVQIENVIGNQGANNDGSNENESLNENKLDVKITEISNNLINESNNPKIGEGETNQTEEKDDNDLDRIKESKKEVNTIEENNKIMLNNGNNENEKDIKKQGNSEGINASNQNITEKISEKKGEDNIKDNNNEGNPVLEKIGKKVEEINSDEKVDIENLGEGGGEQKNLEKKFIEQSNVKENPIQDNKIEDIKLQVRDLHIEINKNKELAKALDDELLNNKSQTKENKESTDEQQKSKPNEPNRNNDDLRTPNGSKDDHVMQNKNNGIHPTPSGNNKVHETPNGNIYQLKREELDKNNIQNKTIKNGDINSMIIETKGNEDSDKSEDEEDEELDNSYSDLLGKEKIYYPKGIKNLGLNCYMNSLLQCLFNIEELREFFLKELKEKKFKKKQQPICYRFAKIMKNLLYSKKKFIVPKKFKEEIAKKNSLFGLNKPADATDLFRTLIDSFLSELKVEDKEEDCENYNNKQKILNIIEKEMNNNIIYKYMNIYNLTTYVCDSPKHGKKLIYSVESDSNIGFNLENILVKRKNKNKKYPITLEECFKYKQEIKYNNQFYCTECKGKVLGKSIEKIIVPPEILIIILNRGRGKKIKNEVEFGKILDVSDFLDDNKKYNNIYYELIGSCNHSGTSSPSGHYTSTCLYDKKYYYFNDKYFLKLDYFDYSGEPYILFYHRRYLKNSNDKLSDIKISMDLNLNEEKLSVEELMKLKNILNIVYNKFQTDNNKSFDVKYKDPNYIFIWRITKEKKQPLIMDFSERPINKKYNLSSIIEMEGSYNIDDYINLDCLDDTYINLEENSEEIYAKITIFLNRVFKNYNATKTTCGDACIIT